MLKLPIFLIACKYITSILCNKLLTVYQQTYTVFDNIFCTVQVSLQIVTWYSCHIGRPWPPRSHTHSRQRTQNVLQCGHVYFICQHRGHKTTSYFKPILSVIGPQHGPNHDLSLHISSYSRPTTQPGAQCNPANTNNTSTTAPTPTEGPRSPTNTPQQRRNMKPWLLHISV